MSVVPKGGCELDKALTMMQTEAAPDALHSDARLLR